MPVKVKYVGGSDEVEIAALPGTRVKRNAQVEVPRHIADRLVRGGDYKRVVAKGTRKADDGDEVEDDEPDTGSQEGAQPAEGAEG
jgi:hypothetical protein